MVQAQVRQSRQSESRYVVCWCVPITPVRKPVWGVLACANHASQKASMWYAGVCQSRQSESQYVVCWCVPITPVRKPVCGVLVCANHTSQKASMWCAGVCQSHQSESQYVVCWCPGVSTSLHFDSWSQGFEPRWQQILSFS